MPGTRRAAPDVPLSERLLLSIGEAAALPWYRHRWPVRTVAERFWEKVNKDGPIPDYAPQLGPCWLWTAHRNCYGYGQFFPHAEGVRQAMAHRWAYEASVGPIPPGLDLDHLCRVPSCVNPAHLEPVTRRENLRRGVQGKGADRLRAKTHCPAGHPYDAENTWHNRGHRYCRECRRQKARVWKAAHREHVAAYAHARRNRGQP